MNKFGFIPLIAAVVFSLLPAQSLEPTQSLLEAQYYTWRQALMRQDYDLWKNTTAGFRQRMVRNLAVSEKKPFPRSLFALPMRPPALTGLKLVGIKVKGPTAAATYFGKIDFGLEGKKPTDNAYVLLFVNERGDWKYDTARFYNLSQLPDVRNRLAKGDKKVLDEQEGFHPLGKIPPTPPLCDKPQYIAKIFVDCPGRKVEATVNNISTHSFEDAREAVIISGGLHNGQNTLTYSVSDIPDGKPAQFSVGIYIMPETPGHLPAKAYYFHVDAEKPVQQNGFAIIDVNKELLATMMPPPPAEKDQQKKKATPAGKTTGKKG